MKLYYPLEVEEAVAHSMAGEQALHVHRICFASSPACFRRAIERGEDIAHLFDQDERRLRATVIDLGVRVVKIEYRGLPRQHVDLCGGPLTRCYTILDQEGREKLERRRKGP